jgi:hypothetical protein
MDFSIQKANEEALKRINDGMPVLVDIKYAYEVLPGMHKNTIGHSGPPIKWSDMCGPMKGAVVGAIKYEGLAVSDEEAVKLVESGGVTFVSNHSMGAVGPMTGMISYSMPLYEVRNDTYGNYAYSTFNEGLGKVMRFGANNEEVLERLKFMEISLAPAQVRSMFVCSCQKHLQWVMKCISATSLPLCYLEKLFCQQFQGSSRMSRNVSELLLS